MPREMDGYARVNGRLNRLTPPARRPLPVVFTGLLPFIYFLLLELVTREGSVFLLRLHYSPEGTFYHSN